MKIALFTAILLGWMCVGESDDRHPPDCCLTVSNTRIPVENIVSYRIQEPTGICAIRAVRFHTRKGIIICTDPDSSWAKRTMESVDRRMTSVVEGRPADCCLTVTNTRIPVENIADYYIQEPTGPCALRAVRFRTTKNKNICSDPEGSWAKRAINVVNERRTLTEEPSEEPDVNDGVTANLITTTTETTTETTTAIQRTGTEGYGHPESCCPTAISTTIPDNPPVAFRPLLTRKRSHSKKKLRKYQSYNRNTNYYNNLSNPDSGWTKIQ